MDSIKRAVAQRVQQMVLNANWNVHISPVASKVNDASKVSELETMVRVMTAYGPRYFVVKVKEQY